MARAIPKLFAIVDPTTGLQFMGAAQTQCHSKAIASIRWDSINIKAFPEAELHPGQGYKLL